MEMWSCRDEEICREGEQLEKIGRERMGFWGNEVGR